MSSPAVTEYPPYYHTYVSRVPEGNIVSTLTQLHEEVLALLKSIPESRAGHRYAEGKWSIRELIGHLLDGERIFAYRALRFARNDGTPLHGFDENEYILNARFDNYTLTDLAEEYDAVRRSTIALFQHLDNAAWRRKGVANNGEVSVRGIAYIIAGHELHHLDVLRKRYLLEQ